MPSLVINGKEFQQKINYWVACCSSRFYLLQAEVLCQRYFIDAGFCLFRFNNKRNYVCGKLKEEEILNTNVVTTDSVSYLAKFLVKIYILYDNWVLIDHVHGTVWKELLATDCLSGIVSDKLSLMDHLGLNVSDKLSPTHQSTLNCW